MKLRIRGNSIRLRLSQTEVSAFEQNAEIEDSISFGDRRLIYALTAQNETKEIRASFENERIEIGVPAAIADQWTKTAQIGFAAEQKLSGGESLKILVEKDFACTNVREDEDESDAFPNPQAGQLC